MFFRGSSPDFRGFRSRTADIPKVCFSTSCGRTEGGTTDNTEGTDGNDWNSRRAQRRRDSESLNFVLAETSDAEMRDGDWVGGGLVWAVG